jgi:LmbE family N-acetylglucosaminyl deacetylase
MSKNILVLAAHPDDETLGCGATIRRLSEEGNNIHLLTLTDGHGARNEKHNRNSELEKCSEILGINSYDSGHFPDNKMDSVPLLEICKFIEKKTPFVPDMIFTHHPGCLNIDHSLVYRATMTVFRPQNGNYFSIYSYYIPSSTDYNPLNNFKGNVYFDVTKYVDEKMNCLQQCYRDEMRPPPHTRSFENVLNLMRTWGAEVGLEYAEKFELIRSIV